MKVEFSGSLSHTGYLDLMATPTYIADYYSVNLKVYIVPSVTGAYYFYGCFNNEGKVWLSSDESPDNKVLIIDVNEWCSLK